MTFKLSSGLSIAMVGVVMLVLGSPAYGQWDRIDRGNVSQSDYGFYWETHLDPDFPPLDSGFTILTSNDPGIVHRVLLDTNRKVYFGYDAAIQVLEKDRQFRVTFRELVLNEDLKSRGFGGDLTGWTELPAPAFPAPQTVRAGDLLQLSLLTSNSSNQKIIDYVSLQEPSRVSRAFELIPPREFFTATGPARDFKVADVELRIDAPRLTVNGKLDERSAQRYDGQSGAIVWIYAGRKGRFLLSLTPHPEFGFRKAGEVRGSSLTFTVGNDTFKIVTGSQIAPGRAAFNLYVLPDPSWRPTYANADLDGFIMGAAERPEDLVSRPSRR